MWPLIRFRERGNLFNMKYLLFLGYPIGVCNIGENTLFNVQKDNQIVGLGRYGYNIWKHTFKGIKL